MVQKKSSLTCHTAVVVMDSQSATCTRTSVSWKSPTATCHTDIGNEERTKRNMSHDRRWLRNFQANMSHSHWWRRTNPVLPITRLPVAENIKRVTCHTVVNNQYEKQSVTCHTEIAGSSAKLNMKSLTAVDGTEKRKKSRGHRWQETAQA